MTREQIREYLLENPIDRSNKSPYQQTANILGISQDAVRGVWRRLRRAGLVENEVVKVEASALGDGAYQNTFTQSGSSASISRESPIEIRNEKQLSEVCSIDLKEWEILEWSCSYAESATKDKEGNPYPPKYSVRAKMRKRTDNLNEERLTEIIKGSLTGIRPVTLKDSLEKKSEKALIVFIADQHVGATILENSLYDIKYDKDTFIDRMRIVAKFIKKKNKDNSYEKLIVCNLGDSLDGYNGMTTRGGHQLPQDITNAKSLDAYLEGNRIFWEAVLTENFKDVEYNCIENSNHGGLGWDYAGNLATRIYLEFRAPHVKVNHLHKIIESFSYGIHNIHLTHGKDQQFMKRNLPLTLNPRVENYLGQYLDLKGYNKKGEVNTFIKGDLHQYAFENGKKFNYFNTPSLFGSSDWVMANIGYTTPGFAYASIHKNENIIETAPIWF